MKPARSCVPATPVSHMTTAAEIETYMPLVRQAVARILRRLPPSVTRDDVMAAGTYGLFDALRKNSGPRGATFEWYARTRIRGAIVDELRVEDWLPRRARREAAESATVSGASQQAGVLRFDDLPESGREALVDSKAASALDVAQESRESATLRAAVASLPERERLIVTEHYFHDVEFKTIAATLGVSQPRVSQLRARAIGKLRSILESGAPHAA